MEEFESASPNLTVYLGNGLTLEAAVDLVVDADAAAGRIGFTLGRMQVVQLPPPSHGQPPFYCFFPPGREDRPVNAAEGGESPDPLSPESVERSGQSYFVVSLTGWRLLLLANPFAYSARCATWATHAMVEQAAVGREAGLWQGLLEAMLRLCQALNGDIVGFNALAGNSMKRLHAVSHRPPPGLGPYPLQRAAAELGAAALRGRAHLGPETGYPLDAFRFGYRDPGESAVLAAELVEKWQRIGGPFATASVAAVLEDGGPALYVVPRNRLLFPFGWPGMAAVMEVMGVGVSSRPDLIGRVRGGEWGHADFGRLLASLRPAGVRSLC